jgi:hypothetical protein
MAVLIFHQLRLRGEARLGDVDARALSELFRFVVGNHRKDTGWCAGQGGEAPGNAEEGGLVSTCDDYNVASVELIAFINNECFATLIKLGDESRHVVNPREGVLPFADRGVGGQREVHFYDECGGVRHDYNGTGWG